MPVSATVRITDNFLANLDSIKQFLSDADSDLFFEQIMDSLFETVIPNLEKFPDMGMDLLSRQAASTEGLIKINALKQYVHKGYSIREYIRGDYLILYANKDSILYLLSIKHHRQLSFDFHSIWIE